MHGRVLRHMALQQRDQPSGLQVGRDEDLEYPDFLDAPRLILEVLSATSAPRDREEKAPAYCRIPGLEELVLIAHDAPRIEVWRRAQGWVPQIVSGTECLRLPSIAGEIPLAAIYGGLALPGP